MNNRLPNTGKEKKADPLVSWITDQCETWEQFRDSNYKERWEEYFTFSIARLPFDRMISEYFWARIPRETFSDFIRSPRAIHTQNHTVLNTGLYQPIDFIIKYENLQEDLTKVLNRLEIPVDLSKLGNEKGTQRKDRRHWSEFINDVDMNYIKSHFEQELRFHRNLGYDV